MKNITKVLLYALAVTIPGGGIAVAGYHLYKYVKGRKEAKNELSTPDPEQSNAKD